MKYICIKVSDIDKYSKLTPIGTPNLWVGLEADNTNHLYRLNHKTKPSSNPRIIARKRFLPFRRAQSLAATNKKLWELSYDQYMDLVSKPCIYCNAKLVENGIRLDRKDSKIGYVFDNVVPCCHPCNKIKSDILTPDEMLVGMSAILHYRSVIKALTIDESPGINK